MLDISFSVFSWLCFLFLSCFLVALANDGWTQDGVKVLQRSLPYSLGEVIHCLRIGKNTNSLSGISSLLARGSDPLSTS